MVVSVLVHWVVLAGAVALTAWILPGVSIEGGVMAVLAVALFIGIVNALVPFVTKHLPRPKSVVLVALLTLVVNALLIWAVAALTDVLIVSSFWAAAAAAVLLAVFSTVLAVVAAGLRTARRKQIARNAQGPQSNW